MKKIAILLPSHWSAIQGGAEYQAKLICRHLVDSGRYEVHWLSRRIHPEYRAQGYTTHRIAAHAGLRAKAFFFDHQALSRQLRDIRPDVIYQRVGSAYTGIAARHALKHNCRLIWHVALDTDVTPFLVKGWRPSTLLKFIDKRYLEYGVRHASHIVVQTHDQNRLLGQYYGRRASMLLRNLHPLPAETLDKSGSLTVLWIANLKPAKQPEIFIRLAQACLDMQQVRFVMIGEAFPGADQQRAFEHAVAAVPNLTYLGKLPIEEVNARLARAHLFVNTSLVEGFANTFIQAWMRQVPVLSLNVDPDGLLEQERIGLCAGGSEPELLNAVRTWLADDALREQTGKRAQCYAEQNHSERNIQALIDIVEMQ
jgi:glycosyltransferase involved in cell wall biosynthesis